MRRRVAFAGLLLALHPIQPDRRLQHQHHIEALIADILHHPRNMLRL